MLEGTWRHLANQCTPIMCLATQGAALRNREAPPARELWVYTHQSTWEGSHGAAGCRGKEPHGLYSLQKC